MSTHDGDSAAVVSQLPADHPAGTNASVTLVSLRRPPGLHEPILSTFIVTYGPGGSAVLHRSPTSGYVLVHVLSGAILAQAWEWASISPGRPGSSRLSPAISPLKTPALSNRRARSLSCSRTIPVLGNSRTNDQPNWSGPTPNKSQRHADHKEFPALAEEWRVQRSRHPDANFQLGHELCKTLPSAVGALLPDVGQWENFATARQAVFAKCPTETSRCALPGHEATGRKCETSRAPGAAFERGGQT